MRTAGLALSDGYTPPITYVTVLKRHNARLFPTPGSPCDDGSGNVKPGTCVDQGITLAHGFDFYLNSHKGIQGTVKPAHYHVLHDENHFGSDAIQIATYWLCFAFCRCTRSVSYCPPAYYAHLVAERGRVLLDRENISEDFGGGSTHRGAGGGGGQGGGGGAGGSSRGGGGGGTAASTSSVASDAGGGQGPHMFMPHPDIMNKMFFV